MLSSAPGRWQPDPPPSYAEAMGEAQSTAPAARSTPRCALQQIGNAAPLWSRASERALSKPLPASGALPKVVQKELLACLDQRQRTERKLGNALDCLREVERDGRSNDPLQVIVARGGLFDDDDYGAYALDAAQRAVFHYEKKRELLLSAHGQRMTQLQQRAAGGSAT